MSTLKIHKKSRFQPNEEIFAASCSVRYKDLFRAKNIWGLWAQKLHMRMTHKIFISLFEKALKLMKSGVCFIVIALVVAELFKILIYANYMTCCVTKWTQNDVKSQKMEIISLGPFSV